MKNFTLCFLLVLCCVKGGGKTPSDSIQTSQKKIAALNYFDAAKKLFADENYLLALNQDIKALEIYNSLNNKRQAGKVILHIAEIHFAINDYDNSIKYYLDALKLFGDNNIKDLEYLTKHDIGDLYLKLEQCDLAFKYLIEVKTVYENNKQYSEKLPRIMQSIGIGYGRCSSLDSALLFFEKALHLINQKDSSIFSGGLMNNIGAIYSKKGENNKALDYYTQSLKLFEKLKLKEGIGVSTSNIAYIYKKQQKYDESIELYEYALKLFMETNSLIYLRDNYLNISEVYQESNNLEQALKYNNLYLTLNDSITNSDILSRMNNLHVQFEIKKKEQELILLEQDKLIIEQKNKLANLKLYLMIGGLILLLLIGGLIVRNLKLKQLVLRKEKEELSHDLSFKNKELEEFALKIIEKNDVLQQLKKEVKELNSEQPENQQKLKEISNAINSNLYIEKDRKEFDLQLDNIHQSFFARLDLRFPDLTKNERRLCSLLVLGLSSKDIATILNISPDGVKKRRYRLRKKLQLETNVDMGEYLKTL